jgi:hypothetical protein
MIVEVYKAFDQHSKNFKAVKIVTDHLGNVNTNEPHLMWLQT